MAIEAGNDAGAYRRIRLGMVGGGQGAFIGAVHRIAARIDDQFELIARDRCNATAIGSSTLEGCEGPLSKIEEFLDLLDE
jgi:hypothetical protein